MAILSSLEKTFVAACATRRSIFDLLEGNRTDCMRVFRGSADGIAGWIVDRFGALAWIQFREGECPLDWASAQEFAQKCHAEMASRGIRTTFLKRYVPDRSRLPNLAKEGLEFERVMGAPEALWVGQENGAKFRILPTENFSPGLFLDQREHRTWVREQSKGLRVLNLFAYTGAFSVMAALGEAAQVTTVDVSKKWLAVARENFSLNRLSTDPHRFFATGAMDFLSTAKKRGELYDLLVIDPPSFSRSERDGVFSLKEHRHVLWELAKACTAPGGLLFFSCNWQQLDQPNLELEMGNVFPLSQWVREKLPPLPADFEGADNPICRVAYRRK